MFAPFASSRAAVLAALCVFAALLASGCTLPGRGRLAPAPKDLPSSMRYVPSDAPAFVVVDTDTSSQAWRRLREGGQAFVPKELAQLFLSSAGTGGPRPAARAALQLNTFRELDPASWVGPAAGVVLLSTDLTQDDAVYGYADVDHPSALQRSLKRERWRPDGAPAGRGSNGFTRWSGHGLVAGVSDESVLFAASSAALDTILARAAQGRVSDDLDLRRDTVESLRNAPVGIVFREDALANQLRRLVQDDPAKLELTRWLDDSSLVASVLDGWVGVNGHDDARGGLQLTGRIHWVPETLRVRRPGTVGRAAMDDLDEATQRAATFDDLGLVAEDIAGSATANGSEFATKQDVPDAGDRVDLFPALEELSGDTVVSSSPYGTFAAVRASRAAAAAADATAVLQRAGLDQITADSDGDVVRIAAPTDLGARVLREAPIPTLAERDDYVAARNEVATPPERTIAWFTFLRDLDGAPGATCVGWLGEAGHDRLTFSVGITPPVRSGELDGGCTAPLARFL